jgi:hypothetical protein
VCGTACCSPRVGLVLHHCPMARGPLGQMSSTTPPAPRRRLGWRLEPALAVPAPNLPPFVSCWIQLSPLPRRRHTPPQEPYTGDIYEPRAAVRGHRGPWDREARTGSCDDGRADTTGARWTVGSTRLGTTRQTIRLGVNPCPTLDRRRRLERRSMINRRS